MIIRQTLVLSKFSIYFAFGMYLVKLSRSQHRRDFKTEKENNFDFFWLNLFFESRMWFILVEGFIFKENVI